MTCSRSQVRAAAVRTRTRVHTRAHTQLQPPSPHTALPAAGTSPAEFGLRIDVSPSVGATLGRAFVSWDLLRREKDFSSNKAMEGQMTVPLLGPGLVHVGAVSFRCVQRPLSRVGRGHRCVQAPHREWGGRTTQVHVHPPLLAPGQDSTLHVSCRARVAAPQPQATVLNRQLSCLAVARGRRFTWKTTEVWGHRGTGADKSSCECSPKAARTCGGRELLHRSPLRLAAPCASTLALPRLA